MSVMRAGRRPGRHGPKGLVGVAFLVAASCSGWSARADTLRIGGDAYVLSYGSGRVATATADGALIGLPDNDQRRHPVEIAVEIVKPPLPEGLRRCSFWRSWPLCHWSREAEGGSSGVPVTLTVFEPLGATFVRYRQTKPADGMTPAFELLDWLASGDLRVEQAR